MRTENIILNKGFEKLAAQPLFASGFGAMKPAARSAAGKMLTARLQQPEVPPANRSAAIDRAAPTINKAMNYALKAYKTKMKAPEGVTGKFKGVQFKGKF